MVIYPVYHVYNKEYIVPDALSNEYMNVMLF